MSKPVAIQSERFTIQRRLGEGGMGVVYLARDHARGCDVALKTLHRVNGMDLYRFKREFRALADLSHPNLVALHDLVCENDNWCLTMDYVEGSSFLEYVCQEGGRRCGLASEDRLRAALVQLVEAVMALHEAGKLHRDLKPSNVLVTPEGRVVVLDFGLVDDMSEVHASREGATIVGTPAYLAPEQATTAGACAASDWYAVGVMLYECMTGRWPFEGGSLKVMLDKLKLVPASPSELIEGLPADLSTLCCELLRVDPKARPTGEEILERVGVATSQSRLFSNPPSEISSTMELPNDSMFVGRSQEREAMASALSNAQRGRAVILALQGPSGIGKSALLRKFLADLARDGGTTVLYGRCYERESLPYKALDAVVDTTSRYLRTLSAAEIEGVLPDDIEALARVFPVLRRVDAVARLTAATSMDNLAPLVDVRARAQRALKQLFARIRSRTMLVVCIDDLQWGDVDSADFLLELTGPPDPPPLLLVASFRSEEARASACLERFLAPERLPAQAAERREIIVAPLTPSDTLALAKALLGPDELAARFALTVAHECRGQPFFLSELVNHCLQQGSSASSGVSLEQVLHARFAALSEPARQLLDVISVAGRPVPERVALRAAGLVPGDLSPLQALRNAKLLRARRTSKSALVETFHDRVRETALAQLDPSRRQALHRWLAVTLAAESDTPPEWLYEHFHLAGDLARAARYAELAAHRAQAALAFRRAAELYGAALDLLPQTADRRALQRSHADALASSGQQVAASRAYLAVAGREAPDAARILQGLAASQLLRAGCNEEGIALARQVLGSLGVAWPASPAAAVLRFLWDRLYVRFRCRPRLMKPRDDVPRDEAESLELLAQLWGPLITTDFLRAHAIAVEGLRRASSAGHRGVLSTFLGFEALVQAVSGNRQAAQRAALVFARAEQLAKPLGVSDTLVGVRLGQAACATYLGHWAQAKSVATELELMCKQLPGQHHTHGLAATMRLTALAFVGEYTALLEALGPALREARAIEQNAALPMLLYLASWAQLSQDDPLAAQAAVDEARSRSESMGSELCDHCVVVGDLEIALYQGKAPQAQDLATQRWAQLLPPGLRGIRMYHDNTLVLRARACLMLAAQRTGAPPLLRSAARDARKLASSPLAFGSSMGDILLAGVAHTRRQHHQAVKHLERALVRAEAGGLMSTACVARYRLAQLRGGSEAGKLVATVKEQLRLLGVVHPTRFVDSFAPGFAPHSPVGLASA